MSLLLGIDLGTTKTPCIAIDVESGQPVASAVSPTIGDITTEDDRKRGRSEWDARRVPQSGFDCLFRIGSDPAVTAQSVCGLGVTGQQHGMVLVDAELTPLTPLINWQDQRGNDLIPHRKRSWVEEARNRCGDDAVKRLGCRLNSGFLGTTLFWLNEQNLIPAGSQACFITDLFVAMLTGQELQTDPSVAGSGGILNVVSRNWDEQAVASLGLECSLLPAVGEADQPAGKLTELAASADPDLQGLRCVPTFSGTRSCPAQTGSFEGVTPGNLTPANFARSVLEGMAENYFNAWQQIIDITEQPKHQPMLVGAGNGLRENPVLADLVARRFGTRPVRTVHREEAAFGAALIGGIAAGVFPSLDEAGQLIRHQTL